MTRKKIIVIVLAIALVGAAGASMIRYVPEGQVGMVRTGGSVRQVPPGLLLLNPLRETLDRIPTETMQIDGVAGIRTVDGFTARVPFRAAVDLTPGEYDAVAGDRGGMSPGEDVTQGLAAGLAAWGSTFTAADFLTRDLSNEAALTLREAGAQMGLRVRELSLEPPDPDLYLLLAEDALAREQPERVRDLIEGALARDPGDWRLRTARGLLLEATGDVEGAEREYVSALQAEPGAEPPLARLFVLLGDAAQLFRLEQILREGLAANPESTKIRNWLALTFIGRGSLAEALQYLEEARDLAPRDVPTLTNLGGLYQKSGRYDDAAEIYRQILEEGPSDQRLLINLGLAELGRGDLPAARDALERAADAGPGSVRLHNLLAEAYRRSGMKEEAQEQLLASYALDPEQPGLRDALTRMMGHPPEPVP